MQKELIDSNLIIYLTARENEEKREKIKKLVEEKDFTASSQSIRETASVLLEKYRFQPQEIKIIIYDLTKTFEIIEDSAEDVLTTLAIHEKSKINFWDSLIVAAMKRHGIKTIYTEDRNFERIAGIKAVNPFK